MSDQKKINLNRRQTLKLGLLGTGLTFLGSQGLAENLCRLTPIQTEGPFYPIHGQLDTNEDLVQLNGKSEKAKGKIIWVQGKVQDLSCQPIAGALVEIWQACHTGKYDHPSDPNPAALDPHFQYWGKSVSDQNGNYRFRTIVPGAYPAAAGWVRPPHIHFKIQKLGYLEMITQMYFSGEKLNSHDRILQRLPLVDQRNVVVELKDSKELGHPVAEFNITLEKA